ncbi:MAG: MurR/RpiR family transcriptional regulator [Spirochaetes bacterium]|nr:MurR/RpiR family transcriptional regulator [Spirochaetota bacterium]
MNLEGGLVLLEESLHGLPGAEKKVAQYILNNPEKFIKENITDTAKESGSSIAAVVRLCKRIGIGGFKDLKLRVTWDISSNRKIKTFLHIEPGLSIEEIADTIVHNSKKVMDAILKMLNFKAIDTAAEKIFNADRLDVYGVGASGIVALDLYQKLLRIGIKCMYNPDSHLQLTSACSLQKSDCAVAISYSGETPIVLKSVEEAGKSGAFTIGITRFGKNPISSIVDLNLPVPFTEPLLREGAMASRLSQLIIVDILFSVIASRNSGIILDYLKRTSEALKHSKH